MSKTSEVAQEIVEDFELLGDWEERYRYLIDMGRKLPAMPDAFKTEATRVKGCQSNVWLVAESSSPANALQFKADSDAAIVKGLVALLVRVYESQTPDFILDYDIDGFFEKLQLHQHLSPTRSNGLHGMIQQIKSLAEKS